LIEGFTPFKRVGVVVAAGVVLCLREDWEAEIGAETDWEVIALCEARFSSASTAPALTAIPIARMNICSFIRQILLPPRGSNLNLCWA
jgi:hypothetical protein